MILFIDDTYYILHNQDSNLNRTGISILTSLRYSLPIYTYTISTYTLKYILLEIYQLSIKWLRKENI